MTKLIPIVVVLLLGLSAGPTMAAPLANGRIRVTAPASAGSITNITSSNWAGYLTTKEKFLGVEALWVMPRVTCPVAHAEVSMWVGLDGFTSNSPGVEQEGSKALCGKANHAPSYYVWWEMFPQPEQRVMNIRPGDQLGAITFWASKHKEFILQVRDLTTGKSFTKAEACAGSCPRTSAEVIAEAPSLNNQQQPLADYGRVTFTHIRVLDGKQRLSGLLNPHWQTVRITEMIKKTLLAQPSKLFQKGQSFISVWKHV